MDVHRTTLCAALGLALLGIVLFPWPPQGQAVPKSGTPWSDFVRTLYPVPRWRWVVATFPGWAGMVVFHSLAVHVRLALGRWPNFGETIPGWVETHLEAVWLVMGSLWFAFAASPLLVVLSLVWPRARPWAGVFLVLGLSIGLAYASMFLAPGPFLNWFFD